MIGMGRIGQAIGRRARHARHGLLPWVIGHHEQDALESEGSSTPFGGGNVSDVGRIEGTAEDPDRRGRRHRPARAATTGANSSISPSWITR